MTQKYNSRDAEVEPRTDEPEYGVINFRRVALDKKGDMVNDDHDCRLSPEDGCTHPSHQMV